MQIIKSTSTDLVPIGEIFGYTIVLSNDSTSQATNVEVEDFLPEGTKLKYAESTKGIYSDISNKLICNIGNLNPFERVAITITVEALYHGIISNFAVVKADYMRPIDSNLRHNPKIPTLI